MKFQELEFPTFSLSRLLKTVFDPATGERICILIDLEDPREMENFKFLNRSELSVQRQAYDVFYEELKHGVMGELGLKGGDMFAYKMTGGSNLDFDDEAVDNKGKSLSLVHDIYPNFDIILCISTYSATAPLTADCKKYNFRGATLHGLNPTIINSGLSVDYNRVSADAERLRSGMTKLDRVVIDFEVGSRKFSLQVHLGNQEAQKSHGLCRGKMPDIANLPAGEIFYVPVSADGRFPLKFDDGTLAIVDVEDGKVTEASTISGQQKTVDTYNAKVKEDPVAGEIGELGFGTQRLPFSGRDIQDEKILGTFHIATGRSDHLGGTLTPDKFKYKKNATHDDILFSPRTTPEVKAPSVRAYRNGSVEILVEDYKPSSYVESLLKGK